MPAFDVEMLRHWLGRTETARDDVTPRLARAFCTTLDSGVEMPELGSQAPLAIHWCLFPTLAKASAIGPDGHPARGGFLPPVALPRRMWASGGVKFLEGLLVGDSVERRSRIADVKIKDGRSGTLCLVTVDHEIFTTRGLAIEERQDIVYCSLAIAPLKPASRPALPAPQWQRAGNTDPVLLFRYSALTFNGHRIHYDRSYATEVEGYAGLVVHGPLQASLLLNFAADLHGSAPLNFGFRGLAPLFVFEAFTLCAWETETGLRLSVQNSAGVHTMDAEAAW